MKTIDELARELILFIRQNMFLPENENLEIVKGKINQMLIDAMVDAKVEELKEWIKDPVTDTIYFKKKRIDELNRMKGSQHE